MDYAYIRVSSVSQNLDRQYEEMIKLGIDPKRIYQDKQSGKDFNRKNYIKLKKKIKEGDNLFIKSIDRLGRNYEAITNEWREISKTIKCNIVVLDMPLLDTRDEGRELINNFIADIVLQILSFVAENERINIKERQKEGIKIAKQKGVKFGRPKIELPDNFNEIVLEIASGRLSYDEAAIELGMKRSTLYKYSKQIYEMAPTIK